MFTLILLSGGAGTRMKYAVPKQYMLLAGKPVIMHILERLDSIQAISDIVVVCTPEYEGTITEMVSQYGIRKPIRYAPAGRTRQESVLSGLSLVTSPDVIIHEAARPFVKVEDFEEIIRCPERNATFGLDIPFTVLRGQDHVEGVLTRSELFNVQLPQKFETTVLKEAHGKALADGMAFTEDASLVFHYFPETIIHICQGRDYNVKLTTRIDMLAGEIIYDEVFRRRR